LIKVDEYTVISISDDRSHYKAAIEQRVGKIKRASHIDFVNGKTANIGALQRKFKVDDIWPQAKIGEVGVWFSFLNICEYAWKNKKTVLAFEDDAIITANNFQQDLEFILSQVPITADAFSVLAPENQQVTAYIEWMDRSIGIGITHADIAPAFKVPNATHICRAYQGYSFVSMIYTPKGAKKILQRVQQTGMYTPADCWLFEQHEQGHLDVYTPVPAAANLVNIDWDRQAPTTVHNSGLLSDLTELS
jgi:GR25 family glycosyltransferase involved in LPS biosynthesis